MTSEPNIFAVGLGASFPEAFVEGLMDRFGHLTPDAFSRIKVIVNTARMQRRVRECLTKRRPMLLPRIMTLAGLESIPAAVGIASARSPLRRRLDFARLVSALIKSDPTVAPSVSAFALADELAKLLDELHGEGVAPSELSKIDTTNVSRHWDRSLKFFDIVRAYAEDQADGYLDSEERQRLVIETLISSWETMSPVDPIIVAGSTGSRGATAALMRAVAGLWNGAVVLPGWDDALDDEGWAAIAASGLEDHPQFRFAAFLNSLGARHADVTKWAGKAVDPARNKLVSLALRPAPVTDVWISQGPSLGPLGVVTQDMTLIEAPSPRAEANAIALAMREALEEGRRIALISPDRSLTRQVTAALDRWGVEPDDSAGRPLALSAPGRLLRQTARLAPDLLAPDAVIALLSNPLVATGGQMRGKHNLILREFELWLRSERIARIDESVFVEWQKERKSDREETWVNWVRTILFGSLVKTSSRLDHRVASLKSLAERIAAGPDGSDSGELWEKAAGEAAFDAISELERAIGDDDELDARAFGDLMDHILNGREIRDPFQPNPDAIILGTLEARVQGADTVILAGLNEGIWPARPALDAWLNRDMRRQAGLLLPDRQIGLSAHDFQQAVAQKNVILTRSIRDAEAETVPSRWINRIQSLLNGLTDTGGPEALRGMKRRGNRYLDWAAELDRPVAPVESAPRPSPRPPVSARPKRLSVTRFQTLVRDPYSIYASQILRLRSLDPFSRQPDARDRGILLHKIVERFLNDGTPPDKPAAKDVLHRLADEEFAALAPFPVIQASWRMSFDTLMDRFLEDETVRQALGQPYPAEQYGEMELGSAAFTVTGTVDRVDLAQDGKLIVYDYKSGSSAKEKEMYYFDRQLLIEAVMVEAGALKRVPKGTVSHVAYIGLGNESYERATALTDEGKYDFRTDTVRAELEQLVAWFAEHRHGYTARRAPRTSRYDGEFDHLSRFGEWDESQDPKPEDVG